MNIIIRQFSQPKSRAVPSPLPHDQTSLRATGRAAAPAAGGDRGWRALFGSWFGMTMLIAWRNLSHDRVRFFVTLVGIVFSVVLMGMQLGLLLNFVRTTAILAERSEADIWVSAVGAKTVDIATPLEERRRFQALSVPGVIKAEPYTVDFGSWKRPDGVNESIILVGVEIDASMGLPWDMQDGIAARDALAMPDGVIIDRLYAAKLGATSIGQLVEINGIRARVAGFTQGIRTFTQSPYVFTAISNARRFAGRSVDHISYVLVRLAPGQDSMQVAERIRERLPDVSVWQTEVFARRSSNYWLFSTGAGVSLIMSGVLGLMVGGVIVAQTLYASTMDRISEYATVRAMGGPSSYLFRIVLGQAFMSGLLGYGIGISIVLTLTILGRNASAAPQMPLWLALSIGGVSLITCALASIVSLRKVMRIDPVRIFR